MTINAFDLSPHGLGLLIHFRFGNGISRFSALLGEEGVQLTKALRVIVGNLVSMLAVGKTQSTIQFSFGGINPQIE